MLEFIENFLSLFPKLFYVLVAFFEASVRFISFSISFVWNFLTLSVSIIPSFLKPFLLLIVSIRVIKFLLGRPSAPSQPDEIITEHSQLRKMKDGRWHEFGTTMTVSRRINREDLK